jgi:hypothetical protein
VEEGQRVLNPVHCACKVTLIVADRAVDAHLLHFERHPGRGIGSKLVGQREVDDRARVDLVTLFCQHAALPEGARHIDLLTKEVHLPLEQFELIHVELLLLLASSLGSHAPARACRRDGFYFQRSVLIFFRSSHGVLP